MVIQKADARASRKDDGHLPDEAAKLTKHAVRVLGKLRQHKISVATAESCTGGLLASLLTDQEGLGRWFDCGFVTYTDEAKSEMLDIDLVEIARQGAVSEEIAAAIAKGALGRSKADIAVAITGFAGPAGPNTKSAWSTSLAPSAADRWSNANAGSARSAAKRSAILPPNADSR